MPSCKINNLQAAYALIEHYGLQHAPWRHGSAGGFAVWLFYATQEVKGVTALVRACLEYQEEIERRADASPDYELQLASDAASLEAALLERTVNRQALAALIRKVKLGPDGGAIWSAVSKAATLSKTHQGSFIRANHRLLDAISETLAGLRSLSRDFADCRRGSYTPGENAWLDSMLRTGIERLDARLPEAPQWDGGDPADIYEEVEALLRLASDSEFQAKVDAHRTLLRVQTPGSRHAHAGQFSGRGPRLRATRTVV